MADLETVLRNYDISGKIISKSRGPLLKIIEFEPAPGTKLKNITTALEDIRRELGVSSLHVEPKKTGNGILFEIPAENFETVDFKKILASAEFETAKKKYALPICIGADIMGNPIFKDLAKMPHLLIGGTTGSGKSVGLNTFMLTLIAAKKPAEIKFVLVDPKKIEFSVYNNQKYLKWPVITESKQAVFALSELAKEMDHRYDIFAENLVKNIAEYNDKGDTPMPYIVCVIDEFADLMATDKSVEKDVMRLAQKARAAGIHLMLATQRPSVDVVTGVLKANFPTRLAYKVASRVDSQTILDTPGAENLIGRGDCLLLASDGELIRLHGAFLPDDDIAEMLKPYACTIKPLVMPKEETDNKKEIAKTKSSSNIKEKKEEGFFRRCWNFFWKLGVREQKRIIKVLLAIGAWVWAQMQESEKGKKRK